MLQQPLKLYPGCGVKGAHVVWGDGEPFKSDILDHYVRIAHSPPFFSFGRKT